jgi:hypothetical protein
MLECLWTKCGAAAKALRTSRQVIPCPAHGLISAGYNPRLLFTGKPLRSHPTFHPQNLQIFPVTAGFSPLSPGPIISKLQK